MVELVIGPRKSGKSTYLIKKMLECTEAGREILVLVPEQATLENEEKILRTMTSLGKADAKGLLDIRVSGITKLGEQVLKKTPLRNKGILKEKGQLLILKKVMDDLELRVFRPPLKPGILREIHGVLEDLREVEEEELEKAAAGAFPGPVEKIRDLLLIRDAYEEYIREDYLDGTKLLQGLTEALAAENMLKGTAIFCDDFYRFSKQQLALIKGLMEQGASFTMALPGNPSADSLFRPVLEILEELEGHLKREGIPYRLTWLDRPHFGSTDMAGLEASLSGRTGVSIPKPMNAVKLLQVPNRDLEVRKLFEGLIQARDRGMAYRELRVICNDLDSYRNLLKFYRRLYDVPMFLNEKVNIHNHPLIRLVLGLIRLKESLDTDTIMDLLATGYLPFPREERERLTAYARENGITRQKWERPIKEEAYPGLEDSRREIIGYLTDCRKALTGKSIGEKAASLYRLLAGMEVYESIQKKTEAFKEAGNYNSVYISTQIWNVLLDTLDQLVAFLGEEEASWENLEALLKTGLEGENISILPVRNDEVLVISSGDAVKERARGVFILGASEGHYPEGPGEDLIFPLGENEVLEKALGWKRDRHSRQRILNLENYFALTLAEDFLQLSYSMSDDQGAAVNPSHLIRRLVRQGYVQQTASHHTDADYAYSREASLVQLIRSTFQQGPPPVLEPDEEAKRLLARLGAYTKEELADGMVAAAIVREALYRDGIPYFSISKMETYGSCPYAFFLKYAIRPAEEGDFEISAIAYGNLFHNVLMRAGQKGFFTDQQDHLDHLRAFFLEEGEKLGLDRYDSLTHAYYRNKAYEEGLSLLEYIRQETAESGYRPVAYELEFGTGKALPPWCFSAESGEAVRLEGKIDRVDLLEQEGESYARVLDYKLNQRAFQEWRIRGGLSFQLPLYLKTLTDNGEKVLGRPVLPGAMGYLPILLKEGKRRISGKSYLNEGAEAFAALEGAMEENLRQHFGKIQQGDFLPEPYYYRPSDQGCTYCRYKNICRIKERRTQRRISKDNDAAGRKDTDNEMD